jgi:hypothetical protein
LKQYVETRTLIGNILLVLHVSHLSSPCRALSIASGISERKISLVTAGEPRHKVSNKLITVEILELALDSGVAGIFPGVLENDPPGGIPPAFLSLLNNSSTSWCFASGAGSTPRRVNLSARDAKQRIAPSDT